MGFLKELLSNIRKPLMLRAVIFACFFFSLLGPFGTITDLTLVQRVVYWTPVLAIVAIIWTVCYALTLRYRGQMPILRLRALLVLLFSAVFTPIIYVYNSNIFPHRPEAATPFVDVAYFVVLMAAAIAVAITILEEVTDPVRPPARPKLMERLPDINEAEISRITVEDHYVQVFLSDGRAERLLMRFADAVAEMDGVPGHCTHRSHWVAEKFIAGHERIENRDFVVTSCGARVPLSRTYRKQLTDRGLI